MSSSSPWQRFQQYFLYYRNLDFSLDISRMKFPDDFFENLQLKIEKAFAAMRELEGGAIANRTENRLVGRSLPKDGCFALEKIAFRCRFGKLALQYGRAVS